MRSIIAIALILIGVAGIGYGGFSYWTREKVIDVGPIEVVSEKKEPVPIPPIVGAVALVGGVVLLMSGPRNDVL